MKYQLVCNAYYCSWQSEIFDTFEEADAIQSCPKCYAKRGVRFKLIEIQE